MCSTAHKDEGTLHGCSPEHSMAQHTQHSSIAGAYHGTKQRSTSRSYLSCESQIPCSWNFVQACNLGRYQKCRPSKYPYTLVRWQRAASTREQVLKPATMLQQISVIRVQCRDNVLIGDSCIAQSMWHAHDWACGYLTLIGIRCMRFISPRVDEHEKRNSARSLSWLCTHSRTYYIYIALYLPPPHWGDFRAAGIGP